MSPSEADLRAALSEGEGDRVDPDDIIGSVRHARARRRTMVLSVAAAVAVVGGTAAGVTALVNGTGSSNGAGSANGPAGAAAQGRFNGGSSGAAGAHGSREQLRRNAGTVPGSVQIADDCKAQQGLGPLPPGSPGAGSLLPAPVKEFVVCAYSDTGIRSSAVPRPVVVTGPAASQLRHSLLTLSATSRPRDCPMVASTSTMALRIVPIAPSGRHLPAITANLGLPSCASLVTNGSTVRYGWRMPARVAALVHLSSGTGGPFQLVPPARGVTGAPPR